MPPALFWTLILGVIATAGVTIALWAWSGLAAPWLALPALLLALVLRRVVR